MIPIAALSLCAIALQHRRANARLAFAGAAAWGAGAVGLVAAGLALASAALSAHSDGKPEQARHLNVLEMYDIAGAVTRDPAIGLVELRTRAPAVERFVRLQASAHYRAAGADNLFALPDGKRMMTTPRPAVARQWIDLVRSRPLLYLRTRAAVWAETLTTPQRDDCPMIIVGVDDDNPAILKQAGLQLRMDAKDAWDEDYASSFIGGPLYSHVFYAVLLIAALGVAARRWRRGYRRPETLAVIGLGLVALAFAASFFVLSIDCDYRFLYALDVAAMAVSASVASTRAEPVARDPQTPLPTWAVALRSSLPHPTR